MEDIMVSRDVTKAAIAQAFSNKGLSQITVPILQPADPFLDMVGEDLRRRIFMTENENGDSLCLRPEFTIPVCLKHIASQALVPHQYAYMGEVFRQNRALSNNFYQAGIEDFGDADEARADARSLKNALDVLNICAPHIKPQIILGDQAVFAAVLEALGLAHGWQKKLLRAFGDDDKLHHIMADLSAKRAPSKLPKDVAAFVDRDDENALIAYLENEMLMAAISPAAGRNPKEIAKRLLEKQKLSSVCLDPAMLNAVKEFLAIRVPLHQAEATLIAFGQKNNLAIEGIIAPFHARNKAFEQAGLTLNEIFYDAGFGRPLDYYTGLIYEIRYEHKVVVGGGRYDHLLIMLGAKKPIPAVGFSIWLDRLDNEINGKERAL